ncbi:MAG TPA: N,N-dimethylformamidase beta subunit family domain-containing protein [Candidatus Dormibacteraeota bacterium]|nr:N,N-dimethylformamidase beta subunit family domain-containing protein [Candidatus Dormibacteraeota bacterium]
MSNRVRFVRRMIGGTVGAALGALPLLVALPAHAAGPCGPPVVNPVACENTNPGTPQSQWDISGSGDSTIQGFSTDISVNVGGTISFKIKSAAAYTVTIYRLGYYQGNGARQIATVTPSAPQNQPACITQASIGLVDCGNWAVSASWTVPATAVSGIYFARLQRTDTGGASHIMFVVRSDASTSDLLFQASDTTWQAYNQYGGYSLYLGNAPASDDGRAFKVSYNRPFATRGQDPGYGTSNWVFYGEFPMIRFLEANGYDVSYTSELDTDRRGSLIENHRTFLSVGHDEYWSAGQRANVEAARAAGVSLAFFSGNESFWKVRWENSIDGSGTANRTLVSYKETKSVNPIDPQDPPTWTGTWRDPTWSPPADGGRPENALTGEIFMVNRGSAAITVPSTYSRLRTWRNTAVASLAAGQTYTMGAQTLGYEWDEDLDNGSRPAGEFDLSSTTVTVPDLLQDYGNTYQQGSATHHLTLYRSSGGGLVFGAGTVQWSWGLDITHDLFPDSGPSTVDPVMRQATVNVLGDMGAQPATLQSGLVAATPSTDATAPTSTITSPASGASVAPGGSLTISGSAIDSGGGVVAGVEVSTDSGATWHPATGTSSWSYAFKPARPGTVQVLSRAVDDSGNLQAPGPGITVTVTGPTTPTFLAKSTIANSTQVAPPAGVVAGDVLLGVLQINAASVNVGGPPGWTLIDDTLAGTAVNQPFHAQLWYKVATPFEPISYTWNVPAGIYVDLAVLDYYNINKGSPIDAVAGRDSGATTKPTTASITTTQAGDMVVAVFQDAFNVSWTPGSGMTERYDFDGNQAQDAIQAAAGPTGARTVTNNDQFNDATAAMIVALKPLQTDTTPPAVSVTAPATGVTVSGTSVPVSASAGDNVAVASVQFFADGAAVGSAVTSPPYQVSWDSTSVANGSHVLTAKAADGAGNTTMSAGVSVTVSNAPPPAISGISAGGVTTSTATIGWTTDVASSSQVEYGTTASYGSSSALDSTAVTSHSVAVSGLAAGTLYHYRVKSAAPGGALAVSSDQTFTTATPPPPVISNVQVSGISASGATVTWTTDTPSDTTVQYGTTTAYGSSASSATLVTSHGQGLSGLVASTLYHYRVLSKDAFGQTTASSDATFTTTNAPPALPTFRSQANVTNGTTVTRPSGTAAGDLLLATLEIDEDPATVTGPAGWTRVLDTVGAPGTGQAFHTQVWWKLAGAGEPASYSWTISGAPWVDIGVIAYTNVNQGTPIDVSSGRDAGTTTTPTTPSVTTTGANELVVALYVNFNSGSWTPGSGMTERYDFDSNEATDVVQASAGSTGTKTSTNSSSGPTTAEIVVLRGT